MVVAALNLIVCILAGASLSHSWKQHQQQAEITVQNLSLLLEEMIQNDISKLDVSLQAAADEVERQIAAGQVDVGKLNEGLTRLEKRLPEVSGLRVADAQGVVRYGKAIPQGKLINVADREYFIRQRDGPGAGLVISAKPVLARISQKWTIPLSRRLQRPDGSFLGVVYANYTLDHLMESFASLDVGNKGLVALYNSEFESVVRYPSTQEGESLIGKPLPQSARFRQLAGQGQESGVFQATSPLDGVARTLSFRKLHATPLYVLVGQASENYLAAWYQEVVATSALVLFFLLMTLLFSWIVYRDWLLAMEQNRLLIQQSRLAAMGAMINNIAHQWRQPLNVLSMIVQNNQLASAANTLDKVSLEQDFEKMMVQIGAMSSTIEDFRGFFSPDKAVQQFALRDSIQSTLSLVKPALKGLEVMLEEGQGVVVRGYANELVQVLVNVMNNAKDAIRERQIPHGEIVVTTGCDEQWGWVAVRDNGGGVPDAVLPKIFDHFFTTKEAGSGIGLYMSKMIMNHMGGDIEARNIEGGAEFTIRLPLAHPG
jgi:signal transduction histidine kinase